MELSHNAGVRAKHLNIFGDGYVLAGVLSLLAALPIVVIIFGVHDTFANPEKAILVLGGMFVGLIILPTRLLLASRTNFKNMFGGKTIAWQT